MHHRPEEVTISGPALVFIMASTSTTTPFLSYPDPDPDPDPEDTRPPPDKPTTSLLRDRLYVGNLHPTVDE
jgi:hypothetical protein